MQMFKGLLLQLLHHLYVRKYTGDRGTEQTSRLLLLQGWQRNAAAHLAMTTCADCSLQHNHHTPLVTSLLHRPEVFNTRHNYAAHV